MHKEHLFHKRYLENQKFQQPRTPYNQYAYFSREDTQHERQLSPWSSQQFRSSKRTEHELRVNKPEKHVHSFHKESPTRQQFTRYKGRSVQLKPLKDSKQQPISKDFFNLLKVQKKQQDLTHHQDKPTIRNIQVKTIQMSLCFEDKISTLPSLTKTNQFGFSETIHHETLRQQPIKVKISKQMKQMHKNYEDQLKAESERSGHAKQGSKKDKFIDINIQKLKPLFFNRIKANKKTAQELTCDTQTFSPVRANANTFVNQQSLRCSGLRYAKRARKVSNYHETIWLQ